MRFCHQILKVNGWFEPINILFLIQFNIFSDTCMVKIEKSAELKIDDSTV